MSRRILFSFLTLLALVLGPVAALAQDGEPEMETFTSADGLLTFSYPAGWLAIDQSEDETGSFFPFIFLTLDEETADRVTMGEPVVPGDYGLMVLVVPLEFLALVGAQFPEDATQGEIAVILAESFWSDGEPPEDDADEPAEEATAEMIGDLVVGEGEDVELSDTLTGGVAAFSTGLEEGVLFVREGGEGLLIVTMAAAYSGEFTDDLRQLAHDLAASAEYTGTAEAIMEQLMAAPEGEIEPSDVDPATLDGNALIDERCTVCHTRERIDTQDKDEANWTRTVDRMIGHGAALDAAERQAVIDYLVETH